MARKKLSIDPLRCTGCGSCESACAVKHTGIDNPDNARIRVIPGDRDEGFYLPTTCQHCEDPPCMAVCPQGAIYKDSKLESVLIDKRLCIGCRMCVSVCPFGAMSFSEAQAKAQKCDLCEGSPECVRVCDAKAIEYVDETLLNHRRLKDSSCAFYNVVHRMAA